jgi:uncharacterized protein (DUF1501 family)
MSKKQLNRRKFLKQSSCAAVGYTTLFSTLLNLKGLNAAAMANSSTLISGDYKAMVCILLGGGNDSFNMLIPRGNPEYAEYGSTRTNLAIPQNQILPIYPNTGDGREFGVHPAMPEVQTLFNSGKAAFLTNVGTLVEPTNINQFYNNSVSLPLGLLSHSDQVKHWQTAFPQARVANGWGGKIGDLLGDMNANQNISMNISLNGSNTFQNGANTIEYAIHPVNGSIGITGYQGEWQFNNMRTAAIDNMVDHNYQDMFMDSYKNTIRNARDAHLQFSSAIEGVTSFNTQFSGDEWELSESMEMIAKVIASRNVLGFSRQTFFIHFGGWDHHDEVLNSQDEMLGVLSNALGEFNSVMEELNVSDCVTVFTISDFARTLTSNGNGTDHGWGGNCLVTGGALNGKNIYGTYPSLALGNNLDIGGGVLIPTTSADEYFAELAMWFGVSNSELSTILPNIGNFYNTGSGTPPVGFMQMS